MCCVRCAVCVVLCALCYCRVSSYHKHTPQVTPKEPSGTIGEDDSGGSVQWEAAWGRRGDDGCGADGGVNEERQGQGGKGAGLPSLL